MVTIFRHRYFLQFAVIFIVLASTGIIVASAQPTQAVVENWRDSDYGFITRMMDRDQAENIYVMGYSAAGDYLVVKKLSPTGDLLWSLNYNPTERVRGVWLSVDNNANPVVLASIVSGSNADPAGWVTVKYDTDGNLLWENKLPGPFSDARRLEIDSSNNLYVSGRMFKTNGFGNTTRDAVLIKYDPGGTTLWEAVFDNNNAVDEPSALTISPDGSRIGVAGMSGNLFMALMYDPDGNLLWSDTNPNLYPAGDVAFGAGNASYFATGTYNQADPNPYQMAIAKFDPAGNSLWINSYSEGDKTYRLTVDNFGNVIATGIDQAGYIDWMTIKTDVDGNLLWSQRYDAGRNNDEIPNMIAVDNLGAIYVTGTGGPNPSSGNISYLKGVIAKYNPDGTPQWAVFDNYAGGRALSLGAGANLASTGFGYLVTTHYTQTGLPDLIPDAPGNLNGIVGYDGFNYYVNLSFSDNANNEFWVNIERCTGSGCTDFTKVGQTLGENSAGFWDESVVEGITYSYRVKALGFMGESMPSTTIEVTVAQGNPPNAPDNLTAQMDNAQVLLTWQDNSVDEEQFFIERCLGTGCTNFTNVDIVGANSTDWLDMNITQGESYSYRLRAWNSHGFSAYSNVSSIDVPALPNNAPILDFIADQTVIELTKLEFTATAIDPDVPPQSLTFSLDAGAPDGTIIDPLTGDFTWTPTSAQGPGTYPVTVNVTDNGIPHLNDSQTFTINVTAFQYRMFIPLIGK